MRTTARISPLLFMAPALTLAGCNLIFGIQEGNLDPGAGGGGTTLCGGASCEDENPCTDDRCNNDQCEHPPAVNPVLVDLETAGDCQQVVCVDAPTPHTESVDDDDDLPPDDGNDCTQNGCENGVPYLPEPEGSVCDGDKFCNSTGGCMNCLLPADCGDDTVCGTIECNANVCGVDPVAVGTILDNGVPGDCQGFSCNGTDEELTSIDKNDDLPTDPDLSDCTVPACNGGVPGGTNAIGGVDCDDGVLEVGGTCLNGVCNDCNSQSQLGCSSGRVCKPDGNCCTQANLLQACGGNCAVVNDNCGGSFTCTCASSPKGTVCDSGDSTCGCTGSAHCTSAGLGPSCITVSGDQRCGCTSPTECNASKFGLRCMGTPLTSCGCTTAADCTGVARGAVCKANQLCGCNSGSDCGAAAPTCDPVLGVCVP